MSETIRTSTPRLPWWPLAAVFLVVLAVQLWLVAVAGTDIPFHDQWGIEGTWLYPHWLSGEFVLADWIHPANENRLFWTYLLDVALFELNGQWDPLVQLCANAVLRAGCAFVLAWALRPTWPIGGFLMAPLLVAVAFLPFLAWHNVLWGIESHAYFALGFSLLTLVLLEPASRSAGRTLAGLLAGLASLVSMAPAALALPPLLALATLRMFEARRWDGRALAAQVWPALLLLGATWLLRVPVPEHAGLRPAAIGQFLASAGRMLAWPHAGAPWAAVAMNAPLAVAIAGRLGGWRRAVPGEDRVLLLGLWAVLVALAGGLLRGGSAELAVGVPSRYVDFLVLLPIANVWCACALAQQCAARWRATVRIVAGAWALFLLVGWVGLSAEVLRGIVLPRARDTLAPVRLVQAFQASGNPDVFAGQPRLLVPHPNPESVRAVLNDPRLQGRLPPSLQPKEPLGPLSRATRWLLRR